MLALQGAPRHETGWGDAPPLPLRPRSLSPSHSILGHITFHPGLAEHPREFRELPCAVSRGLLLAREWIWDAAEALATFNHPSGCYPLLLIYVTPVTLPGDPEYIKSG